MRRFGISTSAILATGYDGTSPGLSNAGEEFSSATSAAEAVDVDTEYEFMLAEYLYRRMYQ